MAKLMTIQDVYDKFHNNEYAHPDIYPREEKLKEGHVVDVNLTIADNAKLVEEHNAMVQSKINAYNQQTQAQFRLLRNEATEALVNDYSLPIDKAEIVESFAFEKEHSNMSGYISSLHDLGEFAAKLIK
jgi:hypothetical protein